MNAPNDGFGPVDVEPVPVAGRLTARSAVPVDSLNFQNAERADLDGDGTVDARDIRIFARQNGLVLLPKFARKLAKLEGRSVDRKRAR